MEEKVSRLRNRFAQFVSEATQYDSQAQRFVMGREVFHLHDPLAVASVIHPNLVETERLSMNVETREGEHYGQTRESQEGFHIDVCLSVKAREFLELFLSRLSPPR